ncbi:helix-turn-helix domain-containing protein [Lentibacillus saliphilus]|uniref:helix-turn-helix domain-containing protein n=1 Tax=Lentibacillus saliphilus TaxID=2737028 RepID=UPI001C3112CF|nr:helix-turn-helix transcriptional regulator [Lentibacillus saliphilus]
MTSLGDRIKTIRKKQHLTLEDLAGDKLSKGMLSLIENNKAKPSIESLEYIASQLNVEMNELLGQPNGQALRHLLHDVQAQFDAGKFEDITAQLENNLSNYPPLYEYGQLLKLYGLSLYHLHADEWQVKINEADNIFLELGLYNDSAQLTIQNADIYTSQRDYSGAYTLLSKKNDMLNKYNAHLDTLIQLTFTTREILLLFALNEYDKAIHLLEETLNYSRTNSLFYKIDGLYRMACFYAMMSGNKKDMNYYLQKLDLYGEFTDDVEVTAFVPLIQSHYYNKYKKDYQKALTYIEEFKDIATREPGDGWKNYYVMEKGKALFGLGDYNQAIHHLTQFKEVPEWVHPFDLSIMYETYAYMARSYVYNDQIEAAVHYLEKAKKGIWNLPNTPYKSFIMHTDDIINEYRTL